MAEQKNKKCKVVMMIANSPYTPYFRFFAEKAANEGNIEFTYIFLSLEKPKTIEATEPFGVKNYWYFFDYRIDKKIQYLKITWKMFRLFKKIKPDIVHTHLFDDSLPGLLAAKWAGIKKRYITKQDTTFHFLYAPKGMRYDKMNNRNATLLIPASQESFDFIVNEEEGNPKKMKIVHHGVDIKEFTSANAEELNWIREKFNPQGKIMIGTVARLVESKGYKFLIEAIEKVVAVRKDVIFVGAGHGPLTEEMQNLINQKGLQDHFILAGFIEKKYIPAFYQSLNIYIHASIYEPFGFVIPEAVFNKVPLITTNTGASRDAFTHLESAFFIREKNADDIADGIFYYLNNNPKSMVENAFQKASEMYTLDKMWEGYRNLYLNE